MHQATVSPISIVRSAALALGCFVVLFSDTAYAQVPNINIQETCRAAAGVMVGLMGGSTTQNDVEICLETENKARQQLIKDWSTFQASDREGCIDSSVYLPSYVEWITCFEMRKSVREARKQQGRNPISGLTNPDGSVTMPPISSLGIMGGTRRSYAQSKNAPRRDYGTVASAAIKAAESAWNKLPPSEFACANQKLTARGDSIQSLARRGILPSDAGVAEIRAQCVSSSSPVPSPVVAQGAQPPTQPFAAQPTPQSPQAPQSQVVEATTELRQTIESLKTDLSDARARVAALEKEKAAADNAVKQAEKARSDAEKSRRDTENGRLADRTKLNALSAQFEAYKESGHAKSDWWWAYALIAGVIGVMAGLAGFPFIKRMRQSRALR